MSLDLCSYLQPSREFVPAALAANRLRHLMLPCVNTIC